MKVSFEVKFDFIEPEEIDHIDNVRLTLALFSQAFDAYLNGFDEWLQKEHPDYGSAFGDTAIPLIREVSQSKGMNP